MREALPLRRASDTFEFTHTSENYVQHLYTATIGYYDDKRPGEIFLNHAKQRSVLDIEAHDLAILISLALQHGITIDHLRKSLTRGENNEALGVAGQLLDHIAAMDQATSNPG